jgi:hypothetical protein
MNPDASKDSHTGSENAFKLIKHWNDDCSANHASCKTAQLLAEVWLPTRVIDVGTLEGKEEPFLYVSNSQTSRYIALSHCWGTKPMLKTTIETLQARLSRIPISSLPRTLRDAVVICRKLGVRYLWIDSLCIIQDSKEYWRQEAAQMSRVYKNAFITISALSSANSNEGCFKTRDIRAVRPCWSLMRDDLGGGSEDAPIFVHPHRSTLEESLLNYVSVALGFWKIEAGLCKRSFCQGGT